MYNPVLSIDISKSKSYAAAFLAYGEPYEKPFSFSHSPEGTSLVTKKLHELESKTGIKPAVVLEATGNYSKPVSSFFENAGFKVFILNPLQTHQQKKKSLRKVKTDPIDANRIAQVYYLNNPQAHLPSPESISDLRNLCRQYDSFNTMYTETQVRFICMLDLIFPNFDTVFTHVCCKSSLKLISSYPSPKSILSANRENLIDIIKTTARGHSLKWVQEKVDKLLIAARESLPSNEAQQSNIPVVNDYIKILMTHQDIMDDLRAHIIKQASLSPAYLLLRSIPGVGELTAAIILSEIGDVFRFPSAKQLVAFSGLDPSVFESGKFKSTNNKVLKRGSSYLRTALYQSTVAGIAKRKGGPINPVLFEFYSKKLSEGKSSKVAIVATCNKLIRIIYGIWKSKQPFVNDH